MINLRYKVYNVRQNVQELLAFRRQLGLMERALREVAEVVKGGIRKQFESSGNYGGERWAPLRPGTNVQRLEQGFPMLPILVRSGALKASWSQTGAKGHYQRVWPTAIEFGSQLKTKKGGHSLAAIHHYGGTWDRGPVYPKRGKALRFWADGIYHFRRSVSGATIKVPARPIIGVDGRLPPAENSLVRTTLDRWLNRWMVRLA